MEFRHYFKSRQGEMVNLLKELVSLESPSTDKKAVDKCSDFIIKEFKKVGTKVTRFPQKKIGDLYTIQYPGLKAKEKKEQILVLTHIDTVWPVGRLQNMPFYLSGSKIFGPGVLDMKAGLVMALYAVRTFHELNIEPQKNIIVFINSAEEVGDDASYDIIRKLARKSEYVLCLEPSLPGGGLKIQRKGRLVVRLEVSGKAAHAGTPDKGINAIDELIDLVRALNKLRRTKGTTLNIGLIQGGEKANIVAEKASATLDMRFWTNVHKQKILDTFKQLSPITPGAKMRFAIESSTPPMEKTESSSALLSRIREIADSSLKMPLDAGKTGGGSDASIASSLGIPTIDGLGPDGNGIHADNEHLLLPSLVRRTALLTELLRQL
ncbi:MAG: M20 family metallopeptidase [Candidatus Aminicenantes bacterium]|nr:MAG: M20 family metallopeptidase [Candidatus Aminicenantes bacterium]